MAIAPLDATFWSDRYAQGEDRWDLGGPSPPLAGFIDGLVDTHLRILIPGAGRAYEAEYLHRKGFDQVYAMDLAEAPFTALLERCPDFPKDHLLREDFFAHQGRYDLILEQTFFCALDPALRARYVQQMHALLVPGGRLVGLLFDDPLNADHPPFGGDRAIYEALFRERFSRVTFAPCRNSVAPRAGRELWFEAWRTDQD